MDEPLSNLDAKLRNEMRLEIRALQQRLTMTMIYVTHDQIEAMTMADQIILMNDGAIEQAGTPSDLYERPASLFAARFIGAPPMNMFTADTRQGVAPGVVVGVRAEHLAIQPAAGRADDHVVCGVEYLGADAIVALRPVADPQGEQVFARVPGSRRPDVGERVSLTWNSDDEHRFDAATGLRLDDGRTQEAPRSVVKG